MLAGIPPTARKRSVAPVPFLEQDRARSVAWFLHFLLCDAGPGSDLTSLSLSLATGKVQRISRPSLGVAVRGTEGAFGDPGPILRGQAPPGPAWASGPHSAAVGWHLCSLHPLLGSGFWGLLAVSRLFWRLGRTDPFRDVSLDVHVSLKPPDPALVHSEGCTGQWEAWDLPRMD